MKRTILTLTLISTLLFSFSAFATPTSGPVVYIEGRLVNTTLTQPSDFLLTTNGPVVDIENNLSENNRPFAVESAPGSNFSVDVDYAPESGIAPQCKVLFSILKGQISTKLEQEQGARFKCVLAGDPNKLDGLTITIKNI